MTTLPPPTGDHQDNDDVISGFPPEAVLAAADFEFEHRHRDCSVTTWTTPRGSHYRCETCRSELLLRPLPPGGVDEALLRRHRHLWAPLLSTEEGDTERERRRETRS